MTSQLVREFNKAIWRVHDNPGRPARLGKKDKSALYFVDESGSTLKNRVWAYYTDTGQSLQEVVVNRGGVPAQYDMPVRIRSINGTLTAVLNPYGLEMEDFTSGGGWVPITAHAFTHTRFGPDPVYLSGLQFLPAAVRPSDPPALTVYVEPFWYKYNGTWDSWEGGDSGSFSAYVPADGIVHFVIVVLDRETNTIVLIDGNDVDVNDPYFGYSGPATDTEIRAISVASKYLPLAAVHLYGSQTTIQVSHITNDLRYWGGEAGLDINGLTAQTAPTPGADYVAIYDAGLAANRKVLLEDIAPGNMAILFSQTADKTIANTVTPTELFGTGVGSVTLPANFLKAGTTIHLSMTGHVSTTGSPDITFAVEVGGSEVGSTGANAIGPGLSEVGWRLWLDITCRTAGASGTIVASGLVRLAASLFGLVKTSTTTVDTTGTLQIEVIGTWGTADAANTISSQTAVVQSLTVTGLS